VRESLWALALPAAVFNFGRGLLTVQAITLSLEDYPHLAGTATGLSFCVRAMVAAGAISALGLVYDRDEAAREGGGAEAGARPPLDASPVPLSAMMLAFSVLSVLVYVGGQLRAAGGRPARPEGRRGVRLAALDGDAEAAAGKGGLAAVPDVVAEWSEVGLDDRDHSTPSAGGSPVLDASGGGGGGGGGEGAHDASQADDDDRGGTTR
jgi:hypothetical protein